MARGRPPSWICFTRFGTTHEEYLVVFVTVQNLVVIGAVISIVCKLNILRVKLENAYSRPKIGVFVGFYPQNGEQYKQDTKRKHVV